MGMLLSTLRATLLRKMLAGEGIVRANYRNKKGQRNVKSCLWRFNGFWNKKLLSKWA